MTARKTLEDDPREKTREIIEENIDISDIKD
jgi:hypothetical protein